MEQHNDGIYTLLFLFGFVPIGYVLTRFDKEIENKLGKVGSTLLFLALLIGPGIYASFLFKMGFLAPLFGIGLGARIDSSIKSNKAAALARAAQQAKLDKMVKEIESGMASVTPGGAPFQFDVTTLSREWRQKLIADGIKRGLKTTTETNHNDKTVLLRFSL